MNTNLHNFGSTSDVQLAVINLALGLWVLVSPWVLSFAAQTTARWAHVCVGLIVAVLAGLKLWFMHQSPPRVSAQR